MPIYFTCKIQEALKLVTGFGKMFFLAALLLMVSGVFAQTTLEDFQKHPEYTLGNYMPYPEPDKSVKYTKAPTGYTPFYISHYGRHGSRYHYSEKDYHDIYNTLLKADQANKLTPVGKQLFAAAQILELRAAPRTGDLTQVGVCQHEGISRRMQKNFPEVFRNRTVRGKKVAPSVNAIASTSGRCIVSMGAFMGELRKNAPNVNVSYVSGASVMPFINTLNFDSVGYSKAPAYAAELTKLWDKVDPNPLMKKLFTDSAYVQKNIQAVDFYNTLYEVTTSMAGMDSSLIMLVNLNASYKGADSVFSLGSLFTEEEQFLLWQTKNAWWYSILGTSPLINSKAGVRWANGTLQHILDEAERVIAMKETPVAATLRFGHDTGLLPLAGLMQLSIANAQVSDLSRLYEQWGNFQVIPMAANLQIVFYRSGNKPILVKFLYNEREVTAPIPCDADKCPIAPYYRWEDVLSYYRKRLDDIAQ